MYPDGQCDEDAPIGVVLVIESWRQNAKLKMPGGHKKPGETPLQTAIRELEGETGLVALKRQFSYVSSERRRRPGLHWAVLFTADVEASDLPWMNNHQRENEGEEPQFLTTTAFATALSERKCLPQHVDRLRDAGLIPERWARIG